MTVRLVVGLTGASGTIYGVTLLRELKRREVETYLVITEGAEMIAKHELGMSRAAIEELASKSYAEDDLLSPLASGSFQVDGVVVVPCSMKTLSAIANGFSSNVLCRAADCTLKEGRKLILVPRETPMNQIHLENMLRVARSGAVILPASPAFYHMPKTIEDLVHFIVGKILDQLAIEHALYARWQGGA
jgi:4-hydroxy-3-polyprenylbenzoate decarboxylase